MVLVDYMSWIYLPQNLTQFIVYPNFAHYFELVEVERLMKNNHNELLNLELFW